MPTTNEIIYNALLDGAEICPSRDKTFDVMDGASREFSAATVWRHCTKLHKDGKVSKKKETYSYGAKYIYYVDETKGWFREFLNFLGL